jgi:sterol desaturase/sphingolipid hydroxylase (fatty acid hydroxylase superfamily)
MSKSRAGIPAPESPRGVDLALEARRGRRRLYPVSLVYSTSSLAVLLLALRSGRPLVAAGFYLGGIALWTYVEYFAHRFVLHGVFPDGPGLVRRLLHRRFDDLHWYHHLRPWDGAHINGTIGDTLPFIASLAALAFLAPLPTAPALVAGLVQAYVAEEWVHHSVHFYLFENPYFRYIKKHHLYHHSPRGRDLAFGLTSGLWDALLGTRIPPEDRKRLYGTAPPAA